MYIRTNIKIDINIYIKIIIIYIYVHMCAYYGSKTDHVASPPPPQTNELTGSDWDIIVNSQKTIHIINIWVFPKIGVPQNGWFIIKNPIKMDDLGVPLFSETSIWTSEKKQVDANHWIIWGIKKNDQKMERTVMNKKTDPPVDGGNPKQPPIKPCKHSNGQ